MTLDKDQNAKEFFYDDYNNIEVSKNNETSNFDNYIEKAMRVTTPLQAKTIFKFLVEKLLEHSRLKAFPWRENLKNLTHEDAVMITKQRLGYCAGYHGAETRYRVEELFECEHPIMGKISLLGEPTADEAYQCGYRQMHLIDLRKENYEKELAEVRQSNKAAWEMYGSELCVGDMIAKEQKLENLITELKNMPHVNGIRKVFNNRSNFLS